MGGFPFINSERRIESSAAAIPVLRHAERLSTFCGGNIYHKQRAKDIRPAFSRAMNCIQ